MILMNKSKEACSEYFWGCHWFLLSPWYRCWLFHVEALYLLEEPCPVLFNRRLSKRSGVVLNGLQNSGDNEEENPLDIAFVFVWRKGERLRLVYVYAQPVIVFGYAQSRLDSLYNDGYVNINDHFIFSSLHSLVLERSDSELSLAYDLYDFLAQWWADEHPCCQSSGYSRSCLENVIASVPTDGEQKLVGHIAGKENIFEHSALLVFWSI